MSQENTSNTQPPIYKRRDITIGFIGWGIISNLVFLLLFYLEDETPLKIGYEFIVIIIWLLPLTAAAILYVKKRVWVCAGIGINLITNVTLGIITLFSTGLMEFMTPSEMIMYISIPLPLSFIFLLTGI